MAFAINTNIASLQAQEYLRTNSDFQSKTINRVTSGLRIISSGDDAAGLAIANTFRSDQSVLSQGVRNANDGLSQLQIADGGISNISKLLDRARTLATQSASGTFSGGADGRALLDGEFQSVISEIDRQAKSIGLNQGGTFNTDLSVFIGGGRGSDAAGVIANGSVSVDLSQSAVDSKALGLQGNTFQSAAVDGAYFTSYGGSSGVTAELKFAGAGFSDANQVAVSVNLSGVGDVNGLVDAINAGIQGAAQGGTAQAAAFAEANIVASADATGKISYSSAKAFAVSDGVGGSAAASQRLLNGNTASASSVNYAAGTFRDDTDALAYTTTVGQTQKLTLQAVGADGGLQKLTVTIAAGSDIDEALTDINTQIQASNQSAIKNIVAVKEAAAGTFGFASTSSFNLTVDLASDATAVGITTGVGTTVTADAVGAGANASISTVGGAEAAVSALANAVTSLGLAQANVGKGQNQFSYAINLASSQLTNLAAAESRIRDADLASEAANLTKAQTLLQAGIAALAQANSAPQGVLALLRG